MIRHLYQRTITQNGKKVKAWYYWFYDEDGKQVRKSCGQNGKPCLKKRDAEAFLASLEDNYEKRVLLNDFCKGMFNPDSDYMKKFKNKRYELDPITIKVKQAYLARILKKFGNRYPDEIMLGEIDDWLLSFERSNSWRNQHIYIFKEMYLELFNYRKISFIPNFSRFAANDKKEKGILSFDEIQRLFPRDYNELIKIWRWKTKTFEPDWQILSYAIMIFTILSTGMRKGEIRALKYSQFVAENAILINCRLDQSNKEINRLKKGTNQNKRWRVSILPERTVEMIKYLTEHRVQIKPSRYIFTFHGEPWKSTQMAKVFIEVLNNNGIDTKARNITLHSLRFTYNTIMRSKIDNTDLRLMVGHLNKEMTDYYDKSQALDHLTELQENKNIIDSIWN